MRNSDGRDFIFAGAGILWGGVQIYKGCKTWRQEHQRLRMNRECTVSALPMGRIEYPSTILTGALAAISCVGYLVWSVFLG